MPANHSDHPAVVAPPPLIFLAGVIAGGLLNWLWPLPFLPRLVGWVLGLALVVTGLGIGFFALRSFRERGTSVDPYASATALVSDGLYRFSRNPIYLAYAIITLGIACLANALWLIIVLPATLIVIDRGVIAREEAYLERKFGETYTSYRARVRRWL